MPPKAVRALMRLLARRLDVAHLPPKVEHHGLLGRLDLQVRRGRGGPPPNHQWAPGHQLHGMPGTELYERLGSIRAGAANRGGPKIWKPRDEVADHAGPAGAVGRDLSDPLQWSVEVLDSKGVPVRRFTGMSDHIDRKWFRRRRAVRRSRPAPTRFGSMPGTPRATRPGPPSSPSRLSDGLGPFDLSLRTGPGLLPGP